MRGAMSLFVWAVIVGLVFHQVLSVIQPDRTKPQRGRRAHRMVTRFLIGPRTIVWMPTRTYLNIRSALFTLIYVLLVLGAVLVVTQKVHPDSGYAARFTDVLTSPGIAAVVFGAFVGLLTGNLMNRVLRGKAGDQLKSSDWLQVAIIVLLIVLGIGGEAVLRSYAARVSKVSFGATNEIAFSETKPSDRQTEHTSNAFKSASPGHGESEYLRAAGGSAGLTKNADLGNTIAKDRKYLTLFQKTEHGDAFSLDPRLDNAEAFVRTFIAPYTSCMAAIYAKTAKAAYVNRQLADVLDEFEHVLDVTNTRIAESAAKNFDEVARKSYEVALKDLLEKPDGHYAADEIAFLQACTPAVSLLCVPVGQDWKPPEEPWRGTDGGVHWLVDKPNDKALTEKSDKAARDEAEKARKGHREIALSCLKRRYGPKSSDQAPTPLPDLTLRSKATDARFFEQLIPPNITEETKNLPYISIAYAGFLAHLGYYEAAALALHNWIEQTPNEKFPWKWYLVRARFVLAGYLEEWIRSQGESTPLSLRQYHIDNFTAIIEAMSRFAAIDKAKAISGTSSLEIGILGVSQSGDDGSCDADNPEQQDLQQYGPLLQSYISALAGYVDHSLKHREDAKRSATQIDKYTQQLNHIGLKCLDESVKKEKRAELLEYYARNQLNLIQQTGTLKNPDVLRQQVQDAIKIIRFAIELIDKQQSNERHQRPSNFLLRISSNSVIERYESLLATQQELKEKERELSNE